jgi:hypothetical protein
LFVTLEWSSISDDQYNHNDKAHEFGLLLGFKSKRPSWYWSAAAGVGRTQYESEYAVYNRYSVYTATDQTSTFSVPLEAQLFWTPFKHFGIGLIGHAAVSKNPFAATLIGIQFS